MGNVNWGKWAGGVPTYGNYGGPGYTGGKLGGTDHSVRPVNDFDAAFRQHDLDYKSTLLGLRNYADRQMFARIEALKATPAWDKLGFLDKAYINAVVPVFTVKITEREVYRFQLDLEKAIKDVANIPHCFLAGTMIDMWPVEAVGLVPDKNGRFDQDKIRAAIWKKPIEQIQTDDWVVSFSDDGLLIPGKVGETFQNRSKHVLDVPAVAAIPASGRRNPDPEAPRRLPCRNTIFNRCNHTPTKVGAQAPRHHLLPANHQQQ